MIIMDNNGRSEEFPTSEDHQIFLEYLKDKRSISQPFKKKVHRL
jgi:hypothetical protein